MTFDQFRKRRLPFFIATGGEFIALFFWLFFLDRGQVVLAIALLWVGFLIERLTVIWWANVNFGEHIQLPIPKKPVWLFLAWLLAITLSEIIIWVAFRATYDSLPDLGIWRGVLALAVLFVGEQLQHSYELHIMKNLSWVGQFFSLNTAWITTLEVIGGAGLLLAIRNPEVFAFAGEQQELAAYLIGGALLLIGLTIEHVVEGQSLVPDVVKKQWEQEAAIA